MQGVCVCRVTSGGGCLAVQPKQGLNLPSPRAGLPFLLGLPHLEPVLSCLLLPGSASISCPFLLFLLLVSPGLSSTGGQR